MQKPKRTMVALSCVLLVGGPALLSGCGKPLIYPMEVEGPQPVAVNDFGDLELLPDTFKGRAVMVAGRIVGAEPQGQGVIIRAEWLPVPNDIRMGPSEDKASRNRQFVVHYPASVDSPGLWNGNKFLAVGRIHEATPGGMLTVPDLDASCLHIWKTREYSITEAMYQDDEFLFPVPEQTYCQKS